MIIDGHLLVGNDSSSSWLGNVMRESRSVNLFGTIGDFRVNYYYASKQVNLTGTTRTRDFFGSDSMGLEQISQYDVSFGEGWNQFVQTIVSQRVYVDSGKTITSAISINKSCTFWRYFAHLRQDHNRRRSLNVYVRSFFENI